MTCLHANDTLSADATKHWLTVDQVLQVVGSTVRVTAARSHRAMYDPEMKSLLCYELQLSCAPSLPSTTSIVTRTCHRDQVDGDEMTAA